MSYEFPAFVQQGWQCPVCKRVYSPTITMCWYCGGKETVTTATCNIDIHDKPTTGTEWLEYLKSFTDKNQK